MEFVRTLLEQQPLMALFLTVAIGYLVGEINIKGFSLGVGAVLFVALAVGWFAPKSVPAPMVGTLGLALFLYAVGVQYGKQFFLGLTSAAGRRANVIALVGVLLSGAVSLAFVKGMNLPLGYGLGLFAGSGTSTPSLQAAIATLGNDDPAVGYSVSYPFGVAGPILFLYIAFMVFKPKIDTTVAAGLELLEVALRNPDHFGRTLGEVVQALPRGAQIVAVRRAHQNMAASGSTTLAEGDVVLVVGPTKGALDEARKILGEVAAGRLVKDRSDLDYVRVFASRPTTVGRMLGDLTLPGDKASVIVQVRRGDAEISPSQDLVLEFGDRVGLLAHRGDFAALRKFFGDSIKGTAEFSYISIGLGMALGFLIGAIQLPVPGIGKLAIGLSGVLVVALILGNLRRTGGMNWTIPLSANLVLRNLGLTLFLAQVGMSSGPKFAAAVAQNGLVMLGLGAIVLVALVLPIFILGLLIYKMPYDEVAGIVAGACGNPAILAYANKLAPTERPDIGYAMIFPGMTIVKILFVDIVPAFRNLKAMHAARSLVLLVALALSACALLDPPPRDEMAKQAAPNLALPPQWVAAGGRAGPVADNWLASWDDTSLNALVAEGLAYNTDLRLAATRVESADAYLRAVSSPAWPQVNLLARGGGKMGGDSSGLKGIGLFASWELDLWGRVRGEAAAGERHYESALLDAEYARQSIAALVAKAWVLAIEARLAKAQAEEMQAAAMQLASLARDRLRVGVGDEYDVALAQANVESLRDTTRSLALAYENALRALETLVGRYPGAAVPVAAMLPRWPGDIPLGLPSELLERRPDLVAAERRVAAAFYRTEAAKAARLPRITLIASGTTLSSDMFVLKDRDNPSFSIGGSLLQPIFLGGYLQAQVDARTAEQKAAIVDYGKVSAKVFGEVESALSAELAAAEREQILARSIRENARALELAQVRYRVGSGDLRGVQQQQIALYSAQVALLRVQSERLVQRVNLHLALGGSFDVPPAAPEKTSALPAHFQMADVRCSATQRDYSCVQRGAEQRHP